MSTVGSAKEDFPRTGFQVTDDRPNRNAGGATLMLDPPSPKLRRGKPRRAKSLARQAIFARREYRCQPGPHRPGCGGSTPPSRRVRVANFDSEVPALNRREHGANPRQPTILRSCAARARLPRRSTQCAGGLHAVRFELRLGEPFRRCGSEVTAIPQARDKLPLFAHEGASPYVGPILKKGTAD